MVCCFSPSDAFQMQIVLSNDAVTATSKLGCRITSLIFFLCPFMETDFCVSVSNRVAVLSTPPVRILVLVGDPMHIEVIPGDEAL